MTYPATCSSQAMGDVHVQIKGLGLKSPSQDWAMSTYGPLRSLARDQHGERLWICSERHAFELLTEKEYRAWPRLMPFAVMTKT